jgi:hypothetical protein
MQPMPGSSAHRPVGQALTHWPRPLHLALVFDLSHPSASSYAAIARNLLDDRVMP